jgi:pimeloyl-ACP methyl ester carboxylesterase
MALNFPLQVWKGTGEKPVLILIHGFGATEKSWTNPYEEFLGRGKISFDYVLTDYGERPSPPYFPLWQLKNYCLSTPLRRLSSRPPSLWEFLKDRGYSLGTWTQGEPYGPIALAVEELDKIVGQLDVVFGEGKRAMLMGHSRGGLVARKWIQDHPDESRRIDGLILLASPHEGSRLADVGDFFSKGIRKVGRFMPRELSLDRGRISFRLSAFYEEMAKLFRGVAIEELRPNSPFILGLKANEPRERRSPIPYLNLVGTSTAFTKLYRISPGDITELKEVTSLIDSLPKMIPAAMLPEEMVNGKGDGLVSKRRARVAWIEPERHKEFPINHLRMLIDPNVRREIIRFLDLTTAAPL